MKEKNYDFTLRVVKLYKYLSANKEYLLSKQVLHLGTMVGTLVSEFEFGQSKVDFSSKLSIALQEANERFYWLSLLRDSSI